MTLKQQQDKMAAEAIRNIEELRQDISEGRKVLTKKEAARQFYVHLVRNGWSITKLGIRPRSYILSHGKTLMHFERKEHDHFLIRKSEVGAQQD